MNKAIMVFLAVSVVLALGASGERYVENVMRYAEIDANGNVINTNTPVQGYSAIGFVCADAKCSKVSGTLWGGKVLTTNTDRLTVSFPSNLQSPYGYGVYYYKPGFRLWEQTADVWGTSDSDPLVTTIYNAKMQTCHSPIASFSVTNAVQPNVPVVMNVQANLDAIAYAALLHRGPLDYVPQQLANDYYSVATRVTLEIYKEGVLVHTQAKDLIIPYSGSANLQFTWTPTDYGNYRAVVHTDVTDSKCLASVRQSAERVFQILQAEPSKECYTILNSLATSNQFPRVGERIQVTFNKISNYALGDKSLTPVPTKVDYSIVRQADSVVVKSGTLNLAANPNAKDATGHSFDWVTTGYMQGAYTIVATGICDSHLCQGLTNRPDQASIQVTLAAPQRFAPVLDGLPDKVLQMNAPAQPRMIDLHQYTTDQDTPLTGITYYLVSQSNPNLIDCRIEANRYVTCDAPAQYKYGISHITVEANDGEFADRDSFTITVNRVAQAPVISNVPNVEFFAGECYSLDLDNYVSDTDNTPDALIWSVTGNVNTRISIDAETHIAQFCSDIVGQEQVVFRVTDPDGLFDTDESIVTVKKKNTAPSISGLPDKEYCKGDGLKARIIDLWQYASDAETADADLIFSITAQSDSGVAQCIIEDSRYVSCAIYDKVGYSDVTVRVSDGSLSSSDVFRLKANLCQTNTAPVLDDLPDQRYAINTMHPRAVDLWQYAYDKESADDKLLFSIVSQQDLSVAECTIESNRYISCNAKSKAGQSSVVVRVSDGELSDTSDFIVTTYMPNTAPEIKGLPDKTYCSDSGLQARIIDLWQYTHDAETPSDKLIYSLEQSNPASAHCAIEQNRYVSCTIGSIGSSLVRVEASDGSLKGTDDFIITSKDCTPVNTAPVISGLPDKEFCAGTGTQSKIIDLWQYAYDKESADDKLSYSILSQSNTAIGSCTVIDNRYITCTVTDKLGSSDIKVQVSDGRLASYDVFALKTKDCTPVNTAPVWLPIPDKEYCAGSGMQSKIVDLWHYAYDKESSDDKLSFGILSSSAEGHTCQLVEGRYVSCNIGPISGEAVVTATASDGKLSSSAGFKINVKDCNTVPSVIVLAPACKEIVKGTYEVRWQASDSDGDELSITVEYSPDNGYRWFVAAKDIPNTGSLMWDTSKVSDQSTYLIRVTATDGKKSVSDLTDCNFIVSNNEAVFEDSDRRKNEITVYKIGMEDKVRTGDVVWFKLEMENTGDSRLEDVRVSISILDLGERRTLGPMDMPRGRTIQLQTYLELLGAKPGFYDVQIQVWNDKVKRTIYRTLEVTP